MNNKRIIIIIQLLLITIITNVSFAQSGKIKMNDEMLTLNNKGNNILLSNEKKKLMKLIYMKNQNNLAIN